MGDACWHSNALYRVGEGCPLPAPAGGASSNKTLHEHVPAAASAATPPRYARQYSRGRGEAAGGEKRNFGCKSVNILTAFVIGYSFVGDGCFV